MNEIRIANLLALTCSIVELLIFTSASLTLISERSGFLNVGILLIFMASIPVAVLVCDVVYPIEKEKKNEQV